MTRLSRRSLLQAGTVAGGPAVASTSAVPSYAGAPGILKPLPPDWFTDFGTNAEMRWDSVSWKDRLTEQRRFAVSMN